MPNDGVASAFLAGCGVDLKAEKPIPYGNFVTKLLESDSGAAAAQPEEAELGSGYDARLTQSLRSRDLAGNELAGNEQQLHMQQSEARKERVLVRPMSAGAPRQPTKAALSLGPSRPQSAWASLRHGAGPKEARGQLGLREKHAAMRGMAQLRESAVAGGAQKMLDALEGHDLDGSGALDYRDFANAVRQHAPLSGGAISGLCRLMDQNGDGTIDLREVPLTPYPLPPLPTPYPTPPIPRTPYPTSSPSTS